MKTYYRKLRQTLYPFVYKIECDKKPIIFEKGSKKKAFRKNVENKKKYSFMLEPSL